VPVLFAVVPVVPLVVLDVPDVPILPCVRAPLLLDDPERPRPVDLAFGRLDCMVVPLPRVPALADPWFVVEELLGLCVVLVDPVPGLVCAAALAPRKTTAVEASINLMLFIAVSFSFGPLKRLKPR